jgi:diaminopimelate epimerase
MGRITSEGIATIDLGSVDGDLAGVMLEGHVIHVGNPHFAIHRAPVTNDVHRLGRSAEVHHRFPNRTNVEFWEIDDAQAGIIHMRVWERGVGETLACGTGACAAAFAARAAASLGDQITVRLPGGDLGIQFEGDRAYMTGSAHFVMDGIVDPAHVMNGMPASSVAVSR